MEARFDGIAGRRRLGASQIGLSGVLASLRRLAHFRWSRVSDFSAYLLPLTAGFLILALAAMVFRARDRHGYGPLACGIVAAAGVLIGKFAWEANPIMYGAVGLLVISSLWKTWPRRDTGHQVTTRPGCNTEEVPKSI